MIINSLIMRLVAVLLLFSLVSDAQKIKTPDELYQELFTAVQVSNIFSDSKVFVDAIAKNDPKVILERYRQASNIPNVRFDILAFLNQNFEFPSENIPAFISEEKNIVKHIESLWTVLTKEPDKASYSERSSLLPLPYPYIVPGGRFREIYYWDSYFTLLGLQRSGKTDLMEQIVNNFDYLIQTYNHVPNGNRTYYLSRSQPPFFAMMVQLLAEGKGESVLLNYEKSLLTEYKYWMEGGSALKKGSAYKRVVKMPDGTCLNRYWDDLDTPRPESYSEDIRTAQNSKRSPQLVYRNLRSAACSGWDFSSRWMADEKDLSSIEAIDIVPVDLNCLLLEMERTIAKVYHLKGEVQKKKQFEQNAAIRQKAILQYCWNARENFFCDYHWKKKQILSKITSAGMFPFYFIDNQKSKIQLAVSVLENKLLKAGGVLTTTVQSGQQWDAPNGWAPLQWVSIRALEKQGKKELATNVAQRWITLNQQVFGRTDKLMEKYNVENTALESGGGEYPAQDGFGWTNGVLLDLMYRYGK